jgi:hypothetical protein
MSTGRDEPPLRVCPHCGEEARTRFERCPNCGKSLFDTPPRFSRRTKALAGVAIVAVLAVPAVVVVSDLASDERDKDERQAAERAELIRTERARIVREQAPRRGAPANLDKPPASASDAEKIAARVALLRSLEDAMTADARSRVRSGEMKGPIRYTKCSALSPTAKVRGEERDLSRSTGRYDCVAVLRLVLEEWYVVE